MISADPKDLFVLAADLELANALEGLLSRSRDLGIEDIEFDIERHINRDSGCRSEAVEYLRPYLGRYRYALIVFDYHGCGSSLPREGIQRNLEKQLARNGWENGAKVIVIDPELEVWVWSHSPTVSRVLGWDDRYPELRRWLGDQQLWPPGDSKPTHPKKAMREAMRHGRVQRSARKFSELATAVELDGCRDPAFNELKTTLRRWFSLETRK